MIAGSTRFRIALADPEVAVGDSIDVIEDVIEPADVLVAAEDFVDGDELLVLVDVETAASGEVTAKAAQAVPFLELVPTNDPMFATTA